MAENTEDMAGKAALAAVTDTLSTKSDAKAAPESVAAAAADETSRSDSNQQQKAGVMSNDSDKSDLVEVVRSDAKMPQAGSAEAEVQRQADAESAKSAKTATMGPDRKDTKLPEKGSAEAEAHRLAAAEKAKAAETSKHGASARPAAAEADASEGNIQFLLTALLLPLVVVGGIYGYAAHNERQGSAGQAALKGAGETRIEREAAAHTADQQAKPAAGKTDKAAAAAPAAGSEKTAAAAPASGGETTVAATTPAEPAEPHASAAPAAEHGPVHWGYGAEDGPAKWGSLDTAYAACGTGQVQSPIDIPLTRGQPGPNFQYEYQASTGSIVNNGHTIMVTPAEGSRLLVNGNPYELVQFHFHTPSENMIGGHSFPMEIHLVHKNAAGQLAVVGVMVEEGGLNEVLERLPVPNAGAAPLALDRAPIDINALLPQSKGYFTFAGSLTTPPCSENVGWIVLSQPIKVPRNSIAKFKQVMKANNRPVQPLNGRVVYSSN